VLGAGFDAAVNDRANRMSWPRGRRRYDLAVMAELRSYRPLPFVLTLDGQARETEAMLVALGHAPSYGGGMKVCPGAVIDDGLLDVVVVGPMSRTTFLRLFPRVFKGRHVDHPAVQVHRAASVGLAAPRANAYADGEPLGALPVSSTVVPGALRVVGARPGT
jgi:diacylglycerol kinase (ATP)